MTDFLRINGITVPVALNSATLDQKDIGEAHEDESGSPIFNRRATKRHWTFRTTILSAAAALAFRDLVTGKGNTFSWENNNFYSAKGLAPASIDSGVTIASGSAKFGTYRLATTSAKVATWAAFTSTSPWTVAFWRSADGGATWHHWVRTSSGGQWLDGVADVSSMATFFGVTSGTVTLGGSVASSFDDVLMMPTVVPSSWPAQMAAYGQALPDLPTLNADGLVIEQNSAIAVVGAAAQLKAYPGTKPPDSFAKNLQDFNFSLLER